MGKDQSPRDIIEWIDAAKRVPREGIDVLMIERSGAMVVGEWDEYLGSFYSRHGLIIIPTHWRELPDPPKEA